jgi:hypothetical protein
MACEDTLVFDTESVKGDITNTFSMLQFVNQNNYETMRTTYMADVPEYFSGSYDEFKQKRNALTQLFAVSGYSNFKNATFRRTLSANAAQAYPACMASASNKPIIAWIESFTDELIVVTVRSGLKGNAKLHYRVVGQHPIESPTVLAAGAEETLMFTFDKSKDFLIALNAVDPTTGASDTTVIQMDRQRRFELQRETKEITVDFWCAAGGRGQTYGSLDWIDGTFIADKDFYLLYETRRVLDAVTVPGTPGIQHYEIDWVKADTEQGKLRRLIAHPTKVNGNNPDTQGKIIITCAITAERQFLKEV